LKCWPANQGIVQNDKEAQEKSFLLILTVDEQKIYCLQVTRILQPQALRRDFLIGIQQSQKIITSAHKPVCIMTGKSHTGMGHVQYLLLLALCPPASPAPRLFDKNGLS